MRTSQAQMAPGTILGNSGSEKTMTLLRLSERPGFDQRRKKGEMELRKFSIRICCRSSFQLDPATKDLTLFFQSPQIRRAENMSKYTLDASVTSKGESNMDFSALDEKLGKGVAKTLSTMIREAVMQGITAVLPEFVKMVGSSPKCGSGGVKLSNTAPLVTPPADTLKYIKLSNTTPVVTLLSDHLKEILDANSSICLGDKPVMKKITWRCKGRKRGLPVSEVLVLNDHCSSTRKTLLTLMPDKPIISDVLILVCSMLIKGHFGSKGNKYGNQWFLPLTFSQIILSPKQNCAGTMKYIKDNFMGDLASLHKIFVPIYLNGHWFLIVVDLLYETVRYLDSFKKCTLMTKRMTVVFGSLNGCTSIAIGALIIRHVMRLAVDLVNDYNNSKRDIIVELAVTD
ncbi:Ulp1 protease family, carboxy-terminal domain protein [Arachis hypogaea]|nr:Ulp1 protease family, carboxy-terminal domain protein [Arachis hypogaea]